MLTGISGIGTDLHRFPSDKHVVARLGLCAGAKITGGKVMSGKTKRCANQAALRSSKPSLAAYYRRLCARMDKGKAVTTTAHELARLVYAMLTKGEEYTNAGQDCFEERYRKRVLRKLIERAKMLGMQIVTASRPAWKHHCRSTTWAVLLERLQLTAGGQAAAQPLCAPTVRPARQRRRRHREHEQRDQ